MIDYCLKHCREAASTASRNIAYVHTVCLLEVAPALRESQVQLPLESFAECCCFVDECFRLFFQHASTTSLPS